MDPIERNRLKALCLELAVKISLDAHDTYSVIGHAKEYWAWLSEELVAGATTKVPTGTDDDIPF